MENLPFLTVVLYSIDLKNIQTEELFENVHFIYELTCKERLN